MHQPQQTTDCSLRGRVRTIRLQAHAKTPTEPPGEEHHRSTLERLGQPSDLLVPDDVEIDVEKVGTRSFRHFRPCCPNHLRSWVAIETVGPGSRW